MLVHSVFTNEEQRKVVWGYIFDALYAPQRGTMLVQSLPMKSRERWFCDVFDTLAMHAGHVHDIIDTNCWAQNGSTHGHVFTAFEHRF